MRAGAGPRAGASGWTFGALGVAAVLVVTLAGCAGSGGLQSVSATDADRWEAVCGQALAPLNPGLPLSGERFAEVVGGFEEVAGLAGQGDLEGARTVFFERAHDFTHDVDIRLREADPGLATDLCVLIAVMEEGLARSEFDLQAIAGQAQEAADLLTEAAEVMGTAE